MMRVKFVKVGAVVMSAVWLVGCATPGAGGPMDSTGVVTGPGGCTYMPGTEPKQKMNQTTAMILGSIAGIAGARALAGGSSAGRKNSAMLLGAITGAFAGNALASNFKVSEDPAGNIKVEMPGGVLFPSGSSSLSNDGRDALKSVPAQVNKFCGVQARIVGHTDNVGAMPSNMALSESRARAVSAALANSGLEASKMTVTGSGPNEPIATNNTADGRQQNRRVEIFIIPPPQQQ
jgi:outer membrane protein OmpA-like peptidoglycan-associated protein